MTSQAMERIVDRVDEKMEVMLSEEAYETLDIRGAKHNTVDNTGTIVVEYPDDTARVYDIEEESEEAIMNVVEEIKADAEKYFNKDLEQSENTHDEDEYDYDEDEYDEEEEEEEEDMTLRF